MRVTSAEFECLFVYVGVSFVFILDEFDDLVEDRCFDLFVFSFEMFVNLFIDFAESFP